MELVDRDEVLKIIRDLNEQADEVEAAAGTKPTAQEALDWAEGRILALPDLGRPAGT